MDLSIIIVSFNTREITIKCLKTVISSIKTADFTSEIIIVDNNSTDGTVADLKKYESAVDLNTKKIRVKVIKNKSNQGFAKANNLAVKQATGKILLFLNSDIEVINDAIPALYKFFLSSENSFDFIGGKLYERDGHTPQPSCGPFYSLPVALGALFMRGDYWGLTRYSPDIIKQVDWVSGACIMCKKENFEKINGFDEKIFMYMEEIDLLYRAKLKNLITGFYPESHFIHLGSASSQGRTEPIVQVYRGYLYFYSKHHPHLQLTILRFMLQLKALVSFTIGKIFSNNYLKKTYGEAFRIAKKN